MPRSPQPRVQPPADLRCDVLTEPVEPCPVQRLGNDGQARSGVQICSLAEHGRGADGIAQPLEVGGRLGEQALGEGRVPTYCGELTERHARQRGGALVPGGDLGAQRSLEQGPGSRVILASQEQQAAPLARLGLARLIAGAPVQHLRLAVQPVALGDGVQLGGQVGSREGDARLYAGRRARRVREVLGTAQLVQRRLELARRCERAGELAPHRERVGQWPGSPIDGQRLLQGGPRGGIVAASQLELAETAQRVRGVGPLLADAPRRQGVAVQRLRVREIAGRGRERGEVHEIGRGDLVTPVTPVQVERRLELAARFVRISGGLRQQAEVVVIGGDAP